MARQLIIGAVWVYVLGLKVSMYAAREKGVSKEEIDRRSSEVAKASCATATCLGRMQSKTNRVCGNGVVSSYGGRGSLVPLIERHYNNRSIQKNGRGKKIEITSDYASMVNNVREKKYTYYELYHYMLHAVKYRDIRMVKLLLDEKANVNWTNDDGETLLSLSCSCYDVPMVDIFIVKLLLEAQAHVELPDKWGSTPLLKAVQSEAIHAVRMLIDSKADVHAEDENGLTPLLAVAAQSCQEDTVRELIFAGAAVGHKNKYGICVLDRVGQRYEAVMAVVKAKNSIDEREGLSKCQSEWLPKLNALRQFISHKHLQSLIKEYMEPYFADTMVHEIISERMRDVHVHRFHLKYAPPVRNRIQDRRAQEQHPAGESPNYRDFFRSAWE